VLFVAHPIDFLQHWSQASGDQRACHPSLHTP
jgi:hypothetical protein